MGYRIFTDVCSDLPLDYSAKNDVTVLPILATLNDKDYMISFDPSAPGYVDLHFFYDGVRAGQSVKTTQITVQNFIDAFEPVLKGGEDVFYISFSSGLSGTYGSACLAAEMLKENYPDRRAVVVDSLSASLGQGLVVYLAQQKRDEGADMDELKRYVEDVRFKVHHWFTVDDLIYLRRGGRVSGATAFIGTVLSIKPILNVDDEGHLIPKEKTQGRKRALKSLIEHMQAAHANVKDYPVMLSHGDSEADARIVEKLIEQAFGVKPRIFHVISPIIGCHAGPGTIALFYVSDEPRG